MSKSRASEGSSPAHERHRPEQTLLYRIVEKHYPEFLAHMVEHGRPLPRPVQSEFEAYLKCGRLEHGFLRVQCGTCHNERLVAFSCKRRGFCPSCGARRMAESAALLMDEVLPHEPMRQLSPGMACSRAMQEPLPRVLSFPYPLRFLFASCPELMGKVLGIVYHTIAAHQIKKAGLSQKEAQTGAVTVLTRDGLMQRSTGRARAAIQRFGSALNLNLHFHRLFLDGVYTQNKHGETIFQRTQAPSGEELATVVHTISRRVAKFLERQGVLERDAEKTYLQLDGMEEDPMQQLIGCSVSYRIAVGPNQGRKVFTLQTLPVADVARGRRRGRWIKPGRESGRV